LRLEPQETLLSQQEEVVMSATSVSKIGFLSMVAAVGLFAASSGFASDPQTSSGHKEGVKVRSVSPNVKGQSIETLDNMVVTMEVVDSNGNAYLLIPLKTYDGKSPVKSTDGKVTLEYVHPYMEPMNR
jgi:hypothetical protein